MDLSVKKHLPFALGSACFAALLMGILGFFVRSSGSAAITCTFSRFVLGSLLISLCLGWQVLKGKDRFHFSCSSFFSGLAIGFCIFFYFLAITQTAVGVAAFLLYLGPVFAVIGESIYQAKFPSMTQCGLILLSFLGLILVSIFVPQEMGHSSMQSSNPNFGMILGLLAAICYAAYILLSRLIPPTVSVIQRSFWQFVAGTLVTGLVWVALSCPLQGVSTGWPYLLAIGLIQGFCVILLIAYAVKYLSAIQFGTISYLEPLTATVMGYYLYHEPISYLQALGFIFIISATLLQSLLTIKK